MPLPRTSLQRLIESSPDIVVATDAQGKVAYYNDGASESLGYAREEIIGCFVARLYPSLEEAKRVKAAMRDPQRDGPGRVVNFATTFVAKDGRGIPVAISGTILYDDSGREQGTIGFAKDLREFIRRDRLALLGEIAMGLSHEINNPLEIITNEAELLARSLERAGSSPELDRAQARLGAIRHEVGRVEGLLRRLSEMAEKEQYATAPYLGDARMIDLKAQQQSSARVLEGSRILVVDDDTGVRESLAEILRADGCEVVTAADGRDALRKMESGSFHVVLSDVVMPEMDGYELFLEVRRRAPQTKVILMTAFYYDKDHVLKRSRLNGLDGVLFKKPIDPARLRDTLRGLLGTGGRSASPDLSEREGAGSSRRPRGSRTSSG
jgi:PAS domain S-box-containing protein